MSEQRAMIHFDPIEHRKPLPLVERESLSSLLEPIMAQLTPVRGMVRTGDRPISVELYTDSAHLERFFRGNWGAPADSLRGTIDAAIVAMCDTPANARWLEPGVRYVNGERTLIACAGSEYYGNIKVSVRGLCSAIAAQRGCGGFLHGASMTLDGLGVVICGASGAGKTTLTRALLETSADVRITYGRVLGHDPTRPAEAFLSSAAISEAVKELWIAVIEPKSSDTLKDIALAGTALAEVFD